MLADLKACSSREKVSCPWIDSLFQLDNLLSIFSKLGFHTEVALNGAPNGIAKYVVGNIYQKKKNVVGNEPIQHKMFANLTKVSTSPVGTTSVLARLTFKPVTASKKMRMISAYYLENVY